MKKMSFFFVLILFAPQLCAETGIIKGSVYDKETNKALAGANLILEGTGYATTSNSAGNFIIRGIPEGQYQLLISYVGYQSLIEMVSLSEMQSAQLDISLSSSPINIGEVLVTSTNKGKLERDIALPLEVMTKNKIEEIPYQTISDALRAEPGLAVMRDGIWSTSLNIRGLSRQNVVTIIDGSRIETATNISAGMSLIDLEDVERLEVIKGGVSSLYGTGATGGVVSIQTAAPVYSDSFLVNGSMQSSYNSVNEGAKGNISLSASSSNWFLKFNGTTRNAENTKTPKGTLENSQFRDNNISVTAGVVPIENHELKIKYQRFDAKDVGIPGGSPFPSGAQAKYPSELREMYSAEYKAQNLLPSLMSLTGKYFHQLIERRVELIPNPNATVNTAADHTTNGFQLQSDWYVSEANRLIAGIDGWQREYEGSRVRYVKPKNQYIIDSPVPNSTYKSLGIFAQDELTILNDQLIVTLGARYDFINVSNEETNNPNYIIVNEVRNDNPPLINDASYPKGNDDDKSWSANLGLLFHATSELDMTLNLAHAFRSPTLEERYQYIDLGGTVYLGNINLEPEKSNSIDLGFRYWGNLLSIKTNFFLNNFTDLVTDRFDVADSLFRKQNIGEASLYGFEISAEVNPIEKIVVYATTSYVRGEDTGSNANLAEIPPINGIAGIKSPIANLFKVDFNANYAGDQNNTASGEARTGGYTLFNLYVNSFPFQIGFVELQFFTGIENIFDRAYKNHLSTNRGLVALEPGRNIFAKIKLSW